jgi:hypothetical protein
MKTNSTPVRRQTSRDLSLLHSTVQGLIGKKCWRVAFTYGGELALDLGRGIAYGLPALAGKKRGEWRFGTRGTPWQLFTPDGLILSKQGSEDELESQAKVLEGRKVTGFSVSVPDSALTISFNGSYLFRVTPTAADDKYGLPYWELFMPGHRLIAAGPGPRWSSQPSNLPSDLP